jgi:hypothetical protein
LKPFSFLTPYLLHLKESFSPHEWPF